MPYLTFSLRVTSDIAAEPQVIVDYTRRLFLTEAQLLAVQKPGGDPPGSYTEIPTLTKIPILNAFIVATDTPVSLLMGSVLPSDGVIALKAGGIIAIIDSQIGSGPASNATINNSGSTPANLSGLAGGT